MNDVEIIKEYRFYKDRWAKGNYKGALNLNNLIYEEIFSRYKRTEGISKKINLEILWSLFKESRFIIKNI